MSNNPDIYLVIATYFPDPKNQWHYSFVYDQVRAIQLARPNYKVIVLNPNFDVSYEFRGIRVIGFRHVTIGTWLCPHLLAWCNVRKMWKALSNASISAEDIVIAHGHLVPMAKYVLAIKRRNHHVKALLQFHDADPYGMLYGTGRFGLIKRVRYFLYHRSLVEKMDMLVGISRNVSRVVKEAPRQSVFNMYEPMKRAMGTLRHFRSAKVKNIYTLHNGVRKCIFSTEGRKKPDGEFVIGCVAVFRDLKDQLTLLKSVALLMDKIPSMTIKIVGVHHSGSMLADCKRLITEKKLPVEIIPSIDHKELQNFYRSLDLFVLPSYFEGFGCVFTESWSCGTPFITCEGQGMDDLIYQEDRHVWLCKQQDPDDLASKILHYYEKRPLQRLCAETDIDILVPKFLKEVEQMMLNDKYANS